MNLDWQSLVVLLIVAAATGYLARMAWQSVVRRKTSSCGGCGHCSSNHHAREPNVVAIQSVSANMTGIDAARKATAGETPPDSQLNS